MNFLLADKFKLNLTDSLDDYSYDTGFDYFDYIYEDSIDQLTLSTTTKRSPMFLLADISTYNDELNTVSYYDYDEQDMYSDDDIDEISTAKLSSMSTIPTTITTTTAATATATTTIQILHYHRRRPYIWNINILDDGYNQQDKQHYNDSHSLNYSSLLLSLLLLLIVNLT